MKRYIILIISLLIMAAPVYASGIFNLQNNALSTGLIGYWPLDGNTTNWATGKTNDIGSGGNNGQLISMSTTTSPVAGKLDQAFIFNGTASYIDAGGASSVLNITGSFTLAVWFKTTMTGTIMMINKTTGAGTAGYELYLVNGTVTSRIDSGSGASLSGVASTLNDGKWHEGVSTYDGTTFKLYVDGVFNTAAASAAPTSNTSATLQLGARAAGLLFGGTLDDARIYNRALSAQEVKQLYGLGAANTAHSNTTTLGTGLTGYWPFDGSVSNWATGKTNDISGSSNTGSLINMSTTTSPTAGKIGQAFKFNGVNQNVNVGGNTTLDFSGTASFTAVAWVNTTQISGTYALVAKYSAGTAWGMFLGQSTGLKLQCLKQVSPFSAFSATTIASNKWYLVACIYNGTTMQPYINGIADGSAVALGSTAAATTIPVQIGEDPGNQFPFAGTIDDVRIYNRALSASEMQQLYAAGATNIDHSNTIALNNGLVGYWPLDGSLINWATGKVSDVSGSVNTGQLLSMSTTTSPVIGKIGQALNFNGSASYIDAGAGTSLNVTTQFTISAWVRPTATKLQIIYGKGTAGNTNFYQCALDASGKLLGSVSNAGTGIFPDSTTAIPLNKWTFVTCVYDSTVSANNIKFYINGVPDVAIGSNTQTTGVGNVSAVDAVLGNDLINAGRIFNGSIDDVRVYNRALSALEVKQLYSMGR